MEGGGLGREWREVRGGRGRRVGKGVKGGEGRREWMEADWRGSGWGARRRGMRKWMEASEWKREKTSHSTRLSRQIQYAHPYASHSDSVN